MDEIKLSISASLSLLCGRRFDLYHVDTHWCTPFADLCLKLVRSALCTEQLTQVGSMKRILTSSHWKEQRVARESLLDQVPQYSFSRFWSGATLRIWRLPGLNSLTLPLPNPQLCQSSNTWWECGSDLALQLFLLPPFPTVSVYNLVRIVVVLASQQAHLIIWWAWSLPKLFVGELLPEFGRRGSRFLVISPPIHSDIGVCKRSTLGLIYNAPYVICTFNQMYMYRLNAQYNSRPLSSHFPCHTCLNMRFFTVHNTTPYHRLKRTHIYYKRTYI
jgi:hypothetical protein